jgi:hypothetical protein
MGPQCFQHTKVRVMLHPVTLRLKTHWPKYNYHTHSFTYGKHTTIQGNTTLYQKDINWKLTHIITQLMSFLFKFAHNLSELWPVAHILQSQAIMLNMSHCYPQPIPLTGFPVPWSHPMYIPLQPPGIRSYTHLYCETGKSKIMFSTIYFYTSQHIDFSS